MAFATDAVVRVAVAEPPAAAAAVVAAAKRDTAAAAAVALSVSVNTLQTLAVVASG